MDPYTLDRDRLLGVLEDVAPQDMAVPAYRAEQVQAWLVRGVDDPAAMTDLPAGLREGLAAVFDPPAQILRHRTADQGLTHKLLLRLSSQDSMAVAARPPPPAQERIGADSRRRSTSQDASEEIETVVMLYPREAGSRATVCISTQAGCAMGCPFCATGQAGFRGQLGVGDVVRQVTIAQRLLRDGTIRVAGAPDHVTNVVFMGMGEPLANLDVTVAAVRWLHDPAGFNLSARAITVSTVGLVPGIHRLSRLGLPITLAVSLHAPNDRLRDDLVPVNRQHPLRELLGACREFMDTTGRRVTFEYVLIDGVNDAPEQAEELAGLVAPLRCHVNLIPYNPTPAVTWTAPPAPVQQAFASVLEEAGVPVTIRRNRGTDIDAACGQLYADYALGSGRTLPMASGAAARVEVRR